MSNKNLPKYPRLEMYYETHYDLRHMDLQDFRNELADNPYLMHTSERSLIEWFKEKKGYRYIKHGSGRYGYVRIERGKWSGKWIW